MPRHSKTLPHADFVPRSQFTAPPAFPPHPPLQSGGWYHARTAEHPGPGRPAVVTPPEKSTRLAITLAALFGPLGLWYLGAGAGLTATVVSAVVITMAGPPSLLVLWPLSVAVAAWSASLLRDQVR